MFKTNHVYIFVSLYGNVSRATYSQILQKYDKTSLFQPCNGVVIFPESTLETITTSHGSSDGQAASPPTLFINVSWGYLLGNWMDS